MSNYDNNNRGALWKNDKRSSEKHPNLRGSAEVDGVEYWVSAWTNKDGGKKPLVSLSFTPKEQQSSGGAPSGQAQVSADLDLDDDIPF